jgi:ABC-2 type transport system permease protein
MNKIWLIMQREFLTRVQKKSFLITTILVPLIFPAIIGVMAYILIEQEKSTKQSIIHVLDESGKFKWDSLKKFIAIKARTPLDTAKADYKKTDDFALLYVPNNFDFKLSQGLTLYSKENESTEKIGNLKSILEDQIKDFKMLKYNVDKETLKDIRSTSVNLGKDGKEKSSNIDVLSGLGFGLGILIYMFVLVYGIQIMQGVIDEKTSKVVEIIVSSVKPFQLMLGKIFGIASVGLLQFTIWIILITILSTVTLGFFGLKMPQQQVIEQISKQSGNQEEIKSLQVNQIGKAQEFLNNAGEVPFMKIALIFLFYFLGGYLLYGALFAAVGSAVESMQESQQFQFPITLPLLIGYLGLFMFVLRDHTSSASFWLSVIPFTSPVAMVGRIAFGVPDWELALSMILLIGGFLFTTWIAGRIYRVGILMTGTKVSWKVMVKWFMMKG